MNPHRTTRIATADDYAAVAEVMFDAVRNGNSDYSRQQREAWVPQVRGGREWAVRLDAQTIVVAEEDGCMLGFMSLTEDGYIDFAYTRPSAQRTGVFRQLHREVEKIARQKGKPRLWVHASLMAQPAFARAGFDVIEEQSVEIRGLWLRRFEMEKPLDGPG